MNLNNIFAKPVDRPIEGVIKADDMHHLLLELEEYVITDEVATRLEELLNNYNNYQGANGVWISGFFGSGKSHLLKILSLVLENQEVSGKKAADVFLEKLNDSPMLAGSLRKSVSIPSKSILFNIDQKADIISKQQFDAVLAVFVKVFDEFCGYYGKQAYIAKFERDLDSRGLYEKFKDAYLEFSGKTWERGREQVIMESINIANAYAKIINSDPKSEQGILDKYRKDYRLSIEDFAQQINSYIEKQPKNFRLNFFVDEVGQYIADNTKLMTNLQTIAESLATKCQGQAWIFVTSQSDIDAVIGDLSNKKGNDFTKIQARFKYPVQLTSANVEEVIQKRLLSKSQASIPELQALYDKEANNFKTLFDFTDGSAKYKNFRSEDHFINSYPFIPYQYSLFQAAIQNLSLHNAFQGKHSSVGERSMLGVFQDVAKTIGNHQIGQLATFDLMFEGIRHSLQSKVINSIIRADAHLDDEYAEQILKALFLVKFVREFKPTVRNICILMRESFDQDPNELESKVQAALNLLEQQTYIQRNGDLYEYLTDEEKAIETEIKNTEIDNQSISNHLQEVIFSQILRQNKIRYPENNQDYPFSKKLDNKIHGRVYELGIHVITPFDEQKEDQKLLDIRSISNPEDLFIMLPDDDRLVRDLSMYLKTDKYIRMETRTTSDETTKRILSEKAISNQRRQQEINQRIKDLIEHADVQLAGQELDLGQSNAQSIIINGFHQLIARTYPNLRMLGNIQYTENDIGKFLDSRNDSLINADMGSITESEQEILTFIQRNKKGGLNTTVKHLIENFEKKPYGWYFAAILSNVAMLCSRGKLEVRENNNLIDKNDLAKALKNTQLHNQLVLELQIQYSASQIRSLKEFFNDYFDKAPASNEAKAIATEILSSLAEQKAKLREVLAEYRPYKFTSTLEEVIDYLDQFVKKPYDKFIDELPKVEDQLLDHKEFIIDPILRFINGSQFKIFTDAISFITEQRPNQAYFDAAKFADLISSLESSKCYQGELIRQIKDLHEELALQISEKLSSTKKEAVESVNIMLDRIKGIEQYQQSTDDKKSEINGIFDTLLGDLNQEKIIPVIKDKVSIFEDKTYPAILDGLISVADCYKPEIQPDDKNNNDAGISAAVASSSSISQDFAVKHEYIGIKNIHVPFTAAWIANDADLENYLESLRKVLKEQLNKGKHIRI